MHNNPSQYFYEGVAHLQSDGSSEYFARNRFDVNKASVQVVVRLNRAHLPRRDANDRIWIKGHVYTSRRYNTRTLYRDPTTRKVSCKKSLVTLVIQCRRVQVFNVKFLDDRNFR